MHSMLQNFLFFVGSESSVKIGGPFCCSLKSSKSTNGKIFHPTRVALVKAFFEKTAAAKMLLALI
jgi:hypothetical protein